MDSAIKYQLITQGLQEVVGEDRIKAVLSEGRSLRIYWGTATTGKPHVGYLAPLLKIAHFLQADCEVTILFADLHAYLDAMKSSWEQLQWRVEYYQAVITITLRSLGIDIQKLRFIRGTEFQLSKEYTLDMYRSMSLCSLRDASKAGTEVVKQSNNPKMGSLLYPGLQALDEEYLKVDAQFGGVDQRKIFMLAEKLLPQLGFNKRSHLMNPMIGSWDTEDSNNKISSSSQQEKIELTDGVKQIKKKVGRAFCREGSTQGGFFQFIKHVVFPICQLKNSQLDGVLNIDRDPKYGGPLQFQDYSQLESAVENSSLHPMDLKQGISQFLIKILEPVRQLANTSDFQKLAEKCYPT